MSSNEDRIPRPQPSIGPILKYTVREKFDAVDFDLKDTKGRVSALEQHQSGVNMLGRVATASIGAVLLLASFSLQQCGERKKLEVQVEGLQRALTEHKMDKAKHEELGGDVLLCQEAEKALDKRVGRIERKLKINQ